MQCEEGVASNLVGTTPNSPNAKAASIDQDLYRNNKGKISNNVLRVVLSANTLFQLMEYGCGEDGQHALPHVERVLVPEQQHHAKGHSMQGKIVLAVESRLKRVKVCLFNKSFSHFYEDVLFS